MENLPHPTTNSRISYSVTVNSLDIRYAQAITLKPLPLNKAFLFPTGENINFFSKDLIIHRNQHVMLTDTIDVAGNGDFSKSVDFATDTYWERHDNTTGVTYAIGDNGVGGSKSLDVTFADTTAVRYLTIKGKHKIPVLAGQLAIIVPAIKTAQVDNLFVSECTVYCYDAAGNEIGTAQSRTVTSSFSTTATTMNEFCYPRSIPRILLPKGTVSITPRLSLLARAGSVTTNFSVNNIFIGIVGS